MSNRNYSLDVIRTFAITFVVANHAIQFLFPFNYKTNGVELFCNMPFTYQLFQFVVFTMGRLGVPLFFMLTGFLLVAREYDTKEKIIRFYKKNFFGLVLIWYIWIILYNAFLLAFEQRQFVIKDILLEFLLLKNVPLIHSWYMNEIIIIYAIIPVLSYFLKKVGHVQELVVGILLFTTVYSYFGWIHYIGFFVTKLMYLAYVIAGYHFAVTKKHYSKLFCTCTFVIGFMTIVGWQIYSYHQNINPSNIWYTNPLHYLVSLSLSYLLFMHIWEKGPLFSNIETISRISFGIYLLHVPAMKITISILPYLNKVTIFNVISLFLISFIVCTIVILIVKRLPLIGKPIFYIK